MPESYQIRDQGSPYFFTCQVVGWVDVFSRKVYRDIIIDRLDYCIKEKELIVYGLCYHDKSCAFDCSIQCREAF